MQTGAAAGRAGVLELFDERRRLLAGELAAGLALGEAHGPPRLAEVGIAGRSQEHQQLAQLAGRRRRARVIAERH